MSDAQSVSLRGGQHALIGRAAPEEAAALLDYLEQVAGESDFLSFGSGEVGLSVEQEAALVRRLHEQGEGVMLKASIDGRLVAIATLMRFPRPRLRHGASFGLSVLRQHWGMGLGRALTEAIILEARALGLARIELRVRHDNARAVSLYEAVGFELEGRLRGAFAVDGVEYDDLLMGIHLHRHRAPR